METRSYIEEIVELVRHWDDERQREALELLQSMSRLKGTPGREFIERTADIKIPAEDLDEMARVIEEECERIDYDDEWDFPS